jgi:aldose 1-epimerase
MIKRQTLTAFALLAGTLAACSNNAAPTDNTQATDSTRKDSSVMTTTAPNLPEVDKFNSTVDGKSTTLYHLKNKNNFRAAITNFGAKVVALLVPDKEGKLRDVVVGFGSIDDYRKSSDGYYGAIVGRFGNRIGKAMFKLDGKEYHLDANNGPNTLHGGKSGFNTKVWDGKQVDSQTVELTYVSPDGEGGFPGTLTTKVTYKLTDDNSLEIDYAITTDKRTVINVTNHNYYNLNGEGSGTINNHELMIPATKMTAVDFGLIPTGIVPVANTPFDFMAPHKIGERIDSASEQLKFGKGYDHNYVLDKGITTTPKQAARIKGDKSGIVMEVLTTEPGVQFYGGNFMNGRNKFKSGATDDLRTAFCLETQHFPDSPNQPAFPTTVLDAGKTYKSTTVMKFSAE